MCPTGSKRIAIHVGSNHFNPFTAIGTAYAVPVIFGIFAIWTALAVSIIIIVIIIIKIIINIKKIMPSTIIIIILTDLETYIVIIILIKNNNNYIN
jgi:hypothetical protein